MGTIIITIMTITDMIMSTDNTLYRLLLWLSPAYPIGGFSYSHGIEAAVEAGQLTTASDLVDWIETVLIGGAGVIDAALFAAAYRAADEDDVESLAAIADSGSVWRGTEELALESSQQGASFLAISNAAWPEPKLARFSAARDGQAALPVAVAVAVAAEEEEHVPSSCSVAPAGQGVTCTGVAQSSAGSGHVIVPAETPSGIPAKPVAGCGLPMSFGPHRTVAGVTVVAW